MTIHCGDQGRYVMSAEENKAIVQRAWAAWKAGNHAVIDELVSEEYVRHALNDTDPDPLRGRDSWKGLGLPGVSEWTTEQVIAESDFVVTRSVVRGTHSVEYKGIAPTGRPFGIAHISIDRVVDGKIVEGWGLVDLLGFGQQVGDVPKEMPFLSSRPPG